MMNSAVSVNQSRSDVNFVLKDSTDTIKAVFYQIVSSFYNIIYYIIHIIHNNSYNI